MGGETAEIPRRNGMLTRRMEGKYDCGPAAISRATGINIRQVKAAWPGGGWPKRDEPAACNAVDSPLHHDEVLRRLGVRRRIIPCGLILDDHDLAGRVVMLAHGESLADQHWVVLTGRRLDGRLIFDWLDGTERELRRKEVEEWYSRGTPACAYVVGEGEIPRVSLLTRIYLYITGWLG